MSIERMCELGQVSRAGWYRRGADRPEDGDLKLRDEIQKIALEWPAYGSRRITAELRRRKWTVNRKRVQRRMREDSSALLCKPRDDMRADGEINVLDVAQITGPGIKLDATLEAVEKRLILLAMKRAKGNATKAAEMLGIWRPRLLRRIEALRLP